MSGTNAFVVRVSANPARLLAGTADGFFSSRDGGTSWQAARGLPKEPFCPVTALAFDPRRSTRLVAGTGVPVSGSGCGAFRSVNGGRRWREIGPKQVAVGAVAFDPRVRRGVYLGTAGDGSDFAGQLLHGTDRRGYTALLTGSDSDLDYDGVVVDPTAPATLYALSNNEGLSKSTDAGAHWTSINDGLPLLTGGLPPPPQFIAAYALAIDPHDSQTLYTGTLGVGSCCIDLVGGDFFHSHDGGAHWTPSTSGLTDLNVLAIAPDPVTDGVVYAGTTSGVFRSPDHGATWTPAGTGLETTFVLSLAVDPSAATLYAGTLGAGVQKLALP